MSELQEGARERVGVIGLGIIGAVWAQHYQAAGVLAATWNRTPRPGALLAASDPAAVARAASVLHVVVSDPPAVDGVLTALESELGPQHLVLQSTTIDPKSSTRFAERVRARGASYVEAPFMGSRPAAEQRKIVFLTGGEPESVPRAHALLGLLATTRRHVGAPSSAAALKLAFNLQVAIQMEGICESLSLARQLGASDDDFFRTLETTVLWSGFHNAKEPKLRNRDFSAQFSVKNMLKDMRLATELGRPGTTPLGVAVRERLAQADREGLSDQDMSALIELLR
jgi:3-hydroxyisobutyrate dehydrogenase-like beta-hydroxyacid dehydrogenase